MTDYLTLEISKAWVKLAKKDVRRIKRNLKKNKRLNTEDAMDLGAMEVEVLNVQIWVEDA